eukprot:3176822-Pyramimonas_sp.AAC.1
MEAARFRAEQGMWEYLVKDRGEFKHEVTGVAIYANPDVMHGKNPEKKKGVREIARAIIQNGGPGKTSKRTARKGGG